MEDAALLGRAPAQEPKRSGKAKSTTSLLAASRSRESEKPAAAAQDASEGEDPKSVDHGGRPAGSADVVGTLTGFDDEHFPLCIDSSRRGSQTSMHTSAGRRPTASANTVDGDDDSRTDLTIKQRIQELKTSLFQNISSILSTNVRKNSLRTSLRHASPLCYTDHPADEWRASQCTTDKRDQPGTRKHNYVGYIASQKVGEKTEHTSQREGKQSRARRTEKVWHGDVEKIARQSKPREDGDSPVRKATSTLTSTEEEFDKGDAYNKKRNKGLQERGTNDEKVLLTEKSQPQNNQKEGCPPPVQLRAVFQDEYSKDGESDTASAEVREPEQPGFDVLLSPEPTVRRTRLTQASVLCTEGHGDTAWHRGHSSRLRLDSISEIPLAHRHSEIVVMSAAGESPKKRRSHEEKASRSARKESRDRDKKKSRHSRSSRRDKSADESNGRRSRRHKRTRDAGDETDMTTKSDDTNTGKAGSTYGRTGATSRKFSFAIGLVPYSHGTMRRTELTRTRDLPFGSTARRELPEEAFTSGGFSPPTSGNVSPELLGLPQLASTNEKTRDGDVSPAPKSEVRRSDVRERTEPSDRKLRKRYKDEERRKRPKAREGEGRPSDGRSPTQTASPSGVASPVSLSGATTPKSPASVSGAASPTSPDRSLRKSKKRTSSSRHERHPKKSSRKSSKPRRSEREELITSISSDSLSPSGEDRESDRKKYKKERHKRHKRHSRSKDRRSRSGRSGSSSGKRRREDGKGKGKRSIDESPEKASQQKTYPHERLAETNLSEMDTESISPEKRTETRERKGSKSRRRSRRRRDRDGRSESRHRKKSSSRSRKKSKRRDEISSDESMDRTTSAVNGERTSRKSKSRHSSKRSRTRGISERHEGKSKGRSSGRSRRHGEKPLEPKDQTVSRRSTRDERHPDRTPRRQESDSRPQRKKRHEKRSRSRSSRKSESRGSLPSADDGRRESRRDTSRRSGSHSSRRSGSKGSRTSGSERRSRSGSRKSKRPEGSSGSTESEMSPERRQHRTKKKRHRHRSAKGKGHDRDERSGSRSSRKRLHAAKSAMDRQYRAKLSEERLAEDYAKPPSMLAYWALLSLCIAGTILLIFVIATYIACVTRPQSAMSATSSPSSANARQTAKVVPLVPTQPLKPKRPYYCASEYCTREARYIGGLLSHATHPCDNFYEHVCEAWVKQHPARSVSTGSLISQNTLLQESVTRRLLDQLSSMRGQRDVQNAVNLHSACVNSNSKLPAVKDSLSWMFSHWTIEHWPRTDPPRNGITAVWRFAAELVRDVDVPTIVKASVSVNPKELEASAVKLDRPRFLLGDADERTNEVIGLFKQAVADVSSELGASVPSDFGDRLMKVCAAFAVLGHTRYGNDAMAVLPYGRLGDGLREFLRVLLRNVRTRIRSDESVVLYSAPYFRREVEDALRLLQPEDTLNYFGFLVLVRFAPFLSQNIGSLRSLFVNSILGRTIADTTDTSLLCAWLIDRVLPGCLAKAAHSWRQSSGQDVATRDWLSQLEAVFLKHARDFRWINELSSLLIRYRRKRHAAAPVGLVPNEGSACAPLNIVSEDNPLMLYRNIVTHGQNEMLRGLYGTSAVLRHRWAGSELSTEATFRRAFQTVHVPAALFNESIPASGTSFMFQLARIAVRFYRALVQLLYENPYERHAPLRFDEEASRQLSDVLSCFQEVGLVAAAGSRSGTALHQVFLDETLAILLAVTAFEELSPIRKIWNLDLRLQGLSDVTALQLFFIYFALDNCESTDPAFHQARLSAKHRVNLPLKHFHQFAEAFGCDPQAPMVASRQSACPVTRGPSHRPQSTTRPRQERLVSSYTSGLPG